MELHEENIIVLDLETLHSAEDCRVCDRQADECTAMSEHRFVKRGWDNKADLGLSIGAYYDYQDSLVQWFDRESLADTMRALVQQAPLMVSFNGIGFDFPLMRRLLRQAADASLGHQEFRRATHELCDQFKILAASSYDILAEIWRVDPENKFVRGLNSLDAILAANGLPAKSGDGAQAPRNWQAGRYAKVMNYCQHDVLLTKQLFELILAQHGTIQRSNGPITLREPDLGARAC